MADWRAPRRGPPRAPVARWRRRLSKTRAARGGHDACNRPSQNALESLTSEGRPTMEEPKPLSRPSLGRGAMAFGLAGCWLLSQPTSARATAWSPTLTVASRADDSPEDDARDDGWSQTMRPELAWRSL